MTLDEIKASRAATILGPEASGTNPRDEIDRCQWAREDFIECSPAYIDWLIAEVERQTVLIQMCAGLISTMDQFHNWHPEDVYKWVLNGMPEAPIDIVTKSASHIPREDAAIGTRKNRTNVSLGFTRKAV